MISRELKAASSKPMILSILAKGDSYGYQILQDILELSGGNWEWSEAMLYPVLKRLSSEGLIQSRWEVQENGRKRKYYQLTENGISALQEERANWMNMHQTLSSLWSNLDESLIRG